MEPSSSNHRYLGPEPVLNLQQIPSNEFAILLSWDEPADTRRIRPDGYEITITTLSGKTLISAWLLASTQNNQNAYTFDSSSIKSLPVATEFICSVRTSIPNLCRSKDEFQELFYDFNFSTRNISCKTRGKIFMISSIMLSVKKKFFVLLYESFKKIPGFRSFHK